MYTIRETAEIMNMTPSAIRYYEREGLLPPVERHESGYRIFSEEDLNMLRVIECLKRSGMSIKDIRRFSEWVRQGDESLQERYNMFLERRKAVEEEMERLRETLEFINMKCGYYERAIAAGTEKVNWQKPCG